MANSQGGLNSTPTWSCNHTIRWTVVSNNIYNLKGLDNGFSMSKSQLTITAGHEWWRSTTNFTTWTQVSVYASYSQLVELVPLRFVRKVSVVCLSVTKASHNFWQNNNSIFLRRHGSRLFCPLFFYVDEHHKGSNCCVVYIYWNLSFQHNMQKSSIDKINKVENH